MSNTHDVKQEASRSSEEAMKEADVHSRTKGTNDAVPGDDKAHAHSHAAHLKTGSGFDAHTKPEGNQPADTRQDLREPPQEVNRSGKQERR